MYSTRWKRGENRQLGSNLIWCSFTVRPKRSPHPFWIPFGINTLQHAITVCSVECLKTPAVSMLCRYYANVHLIAVGWRNGQQMADVIDRKIKKKNPWSWDCFGVCAWVSFSCQSCYSGRILFGFFYFKDDSNKSLLISLVSFSDSFDGFSFSVNAVIRSLILSSFFGDTYATGEKKI